MNQRTVRRSQRRLVAAAFVAAAMPILQPILRSFLAALSATAAIAIRGIGTTTTTTKTTTISTISTMLSSTTIKPTTETISVVSAFPMISTRALHSNVLSSRGTTRSIQTRTLTPERSRNCRCRSRCGVRRDDAEDSGSRRRITPENEKRYARLREEVVRIAEELWGGREHIPGLAPACDGENDETEDSVPLLPLSSLWTEGEASLPASVPHAERGAFFRTLALEGCPEAQHSYGLLLWSGFGGVQRDAQESARFHAAAACQHHLDAIAVLGGCVRTGTGMAGVGTKHKPKPKQKQKQKQKRNQQNGAPNPELGLEWIDFCATVAGNPSGVNKRAAQLEQNGSDAEATGLYQACYDSGRANALVVFNLGWCHRHGLGCAKNAAGGIALWEEAAGMAPDEGSEEAAWNLCEEYSREDPAEAQKWRDLAEELGFYE